MDDHWVDLERQAGVVLTRDQATWTRDEADLVWELVCDIRLSRELRKFIYRRVRDWHVADEILQSCLSELAARRGYRAAGSNGSVGLFRAYIYGALRYAIADYFAALKRDAALLRPANDEDSDDRRFERRLQSKLQLEAAMLKLDERSRFIVKEKHEGLSHAEIAERLGLQVTNVRAIYSRAMKRLLALLRAST